MSTRRSFGRLRKRTSGRWQAGYVGPDGRVHNAPQTFIAKIDAEAWLAAERKRIEADEWTPPIERTAQKYHQGITLAEYATPWLERRDLKPRTRAHYRAILDKRLLPAFGEIPLKRITRKGIREWLDAQGNRTPTYRAHAYALLRTVLNSAVEDELIAVNPCTIKGALVNESASGFVRAREAAGRPDLRFHDLRHTGAVLAAQAGATLAELMQRLGHSTPEAAMIYQHAARDRDAEIAKRLSAMTGYESEGDE